MCHLFQCVTLSLDLVQRLITYFFACFIFCVVYIALTAALIGGMTYGYKYYLAEYYTLNSTLHAIRKISSNPLQSQLSEFDTKHYRNLIQFYEEQETAKTEVTSAERRKTLEFIPKPSPTRLPSVTTQTTEEALRTNADQDELENNKLVSEDDMDVDSATLDSNEDIERATVEADDSVTFDVSEYVKKINWIDTNEVTATDELVKEHVTTATDELITKHVFGSTSKKLIEFAEDSPLLRNLLPVNPESSTASSTNKKGLDMKYYVDKIKSVLSQDIMMRRTKEPQIFDVIPLQTTKNTRTSERKVIDILQKHVTALRGEVTTAYKPTSTEGTSSYFSNKTPMREYVSKLNAALSRQGGKTTEKIVIV